MIVTAWPALYDQGQLKSGQSVLVHGGAGGLGHVAIQLAKYTGAKIATMISTPEKAKLVKELGADKVINYRTENVKDAVTEWTKKDGADLVLDFVGHENFAKSFEQVASYGTLVNTVVSDWPKGNNVWEEFKNIQIKFVNMGWPQVVMNHEGRVHQKNMLDQAAKIIEENKLRPYVFKVYSMEEIGQAHVDLEGGKVTGRIVLEVHKQ